MRQNPHVRICRGPGSATTLVYPTIPGHHVQVDVTFLKLVGKDGRATRRYQYTAIDDATRIRALKVYTRHTQKNAMHFLDYVIKRVPFRMHTVRTDRGHEFQVQFHGTWPTTASGTSTSRPGRHSSTARWSGRIGPTSKRSISC